MRRFLSDISPQQMTRLVLGTLIILAALYVLSAFFEPLGWAAVMAIATWPLYQRFQRALPPKARRNIAPLLFTVAITLIFIVPIFLGVVEMGRELNGLVAWLRDADHGGSVVPDYLDKLASGGHHHRRLVAQQHDRRRRHHRALRPRGYRHPGAGNTAHGYFHRPQLYLLCCCRPDAVLPVPRRRFDRPGARRFSCAAPWAARVWNCPSS